MVEKMAEKMVCQEELLKNLIMKYGTDCKKASEIFSVQQAFPTDKKEIKTIGIYYYRFYNGGIEHVMSNLAKIFAACGYKVIIITNEEVNELDYELPLGVERYVLYEPFDMEDCQGVMVHVNKLIRCIKEKDIDLVIHNAWLSLNLFWDICAIKYAGAYCVVYAHGSYGVGVMYGYPYVLDTQYQYAEADAMVVLSTSDEVYWRMVNSNVHKVHNPLSFLPSEQKVSDLTSHNIIWVGRIDDPSKNAEDALRIFKIVSEMVPDVTLTMCGYMNDILTKKMALLAEELGVTEKVLFTGFTNNIPDYLSKASVFLSTSDGEGYPLVTSEAFAAGLPIVSYEMPYLTLYNESNAVLQVEWKNVVAAADAIVLLLHDKNLRNKLGANARCYALDLEKIDFAAIWEDIFQSVLVSKNSPELTVEEYKEQLITSNHIIRRAIQKIFTTNSYANQICMDCSEKIREANTILETERQMMGNKEKELEEMQKRYEISEKISWERAEVIENLQRNIEGIYRSLTYRIGNIVLFIPKKIRELLRRQKNRKSDY